jgi:PAS domain S-box-containing protein
LTAPETNTKEFLENILESMEGGVLTVDKNGRVTSFNGSAEEITGFSRKEAIGQDCRNILRSEICEDACPLPQVLKTGKPVFSYEVIINGKSGKKVPVNITTSPLLSSNGEIIGAIENFRDLSKHKGLWGKLREERNRAQQYLNIAGVVIVAINKRGIITLINKKGCDVIGYAEEEIVGQNWFDLCVPDSEREARKDTFKRVMNGER